MDSYIPATEKGQWILKYCFVVIVGFQSPLIG